LTQKGKEILLFSGLKRLLRDQSGYGKGRRRGRLSPAGPACQREGRWGPAVGQIEGERGGARCLAGWAALRAESKTSREGGAGLWGSAGPHRGPVLAMPGGSRLGWLAAAAFFLFFSFPKHFPY